MRRELPIDHPEFGKVEICTCRASEVAQTSYQRIQRMSNLQAFESMTFETFKVHGRMGLGDEQSRFSPTRVQALQSREIVRVSSGEFFTACITRGMNSGLLGRWEVS